MANQSMDQLTADPSPLSTDVYLVLKSGDQRPKTQTRTVLLTGLPTTARQINTTAPLTGGGDLSADRTLAVSTATTSATGVVQIAASGEVSGSKVPAANDSRLSDSRTPTAHKTSHQVGGSDELSIAGLQGVAAQPQLVAWQRNTAAVASRATCDFEEGPGASIAIADDSGAGRVKVTIGAADPASWVVTTEDLWIAPADWQFPEGSFAAIAGETGHPGIGTITTLAVSGSRASTRLGQDTTARLVKPVDVNRWVALIRLPSITNVKVRVGLVQDETSTTGGTDAILLVYDSALGANWRARTRAAGTQSETNSSTAATANTWWQLEAVQGPSGTWVFFVNGTQVASLSTNVPTVPLNAALIVETSAIAAAVMHIDLFSLRTNVLFPRYP